jgi:hypothetical protein
MGFEPMVGVLQTPALPLGYVAEDTISLQVSALSVEGMPRLTANR